MHVASSGLLKLITSTVRFSLRVICKQLEVSNLLRAQANSVFYFRRNGKRVPAIRVESLVRLIGAVICLPAAPRVHFLFADVYNETCMPVSLAHGNQLPLPKLQSASRHQSDSCKQRHSKYLVLIFRPLLEKVRRVLRCIRCVEWKSCLTREVVWAYG